LFAEQAYQVRENFIRLRWWWSLKRQRGRRSILWLERNVSGIYTFKAVVARTLVAISTMVSSSSGFTGSRIRTIRFWRIWIVEHGA